MLTFRIDKEQQLRIFSKDRMPLRPPCPGSAPCALGCCMTRGVNEETVTAIPWAERRVAPVCTLAVLRFVSRFLGFLLLRHNRHNSLFNAVDGIRGGKDQVARARRQKGNGSERVVDKWVPSGNIHKCKRMKGKKRGGWVKRGQGVRQIILLHYLQNLVGLIRKYCSQGGMDTWQRWHARVFAISFYCS